MWKHVPRPTDARVLPLKWVWKYKFSEDGKLEKYKARICVQGDLQVVWNDTYTTTLSSRVIRTLLALACAYWYRINQRDIVNTFLYSKIDQVVYVEFPLGMEEPGYCLPVKWALYSLKQSPNLWPKEFSSSLLKLGLKQYTTERCLHYNKYLIVFFFVDGVITLYKDKDSEKFEELWRKLSAIYENQDMGEAKHFLGMRILQDGDHNILYLCQDAYIEKIAMRFHLETDKAPATPFPAGVKLVKYKGWASKEHTHMFQQKVGSLLYATIITRADASLAATKLSAFMTNLSPEHMRLVD